MKKVGYRENVNLNFIISIMMYLIVIVAGYILLKLSEFNSLNILEISYTVLYIISFFSFVSYVLMKESGDNNYLIYSLINILSGSYIVLCFFSKNSNLVLSDAMFIYTFANILNDGYQCMKYQKNRLELMPKLAISLILFVLGIYTAISIVGKYDVSCMILGYYFLIFGLLKLLENMMLVLLINPKVEEKGKKIFKYKTQEKPKVTTKPKVKEIKKRKPVVKEKSRKSKSNKNKKE